MAVQLRLTKDTLRVEQVVGDGKNQKIIEEVLYVPSEKPDIEKVLKVDVDVKPHARIRVINDKVIVEGRIEVRTLYVAETNEGDQPVHHMEHDFKFGAYVDVPGAEEDMDADVDVDVEDVNWDDGYWDDNGNGSCRLRVTIVLRLRARVTAVQPIEVVTGAELVQTPATTNGNTSGVITG